jgi:hypothetical protein
MNTATQITSQDVIQKLARYGLKECTQELRCECDRDFLYAFERLDDESGTCYGCETVDDLFTLLSLMEEALININ